MRESLCTTNCCPEVDFDVNKGRITLYDDFNNSIVMSPLRFESFICAYKDTQPTSVPLTGDGVRIVLKDSEFEVLVSKYNNRFKNTQ